MTSRLNPYISFNGDAKQAMEFYQQVLGGTLAVNSFGEFGMTDAPADGVMHARLDSAAGYTIMASDLAPGMPHNAGDSISISISGDAAEELRGYWEKLAAAGEVSMPLEKQVWGDEFGLLKDQFGIHWMVNISQPTAS